MTALRPAPDEPNAVLAEAPSGRAKRLLVVGAGALVLLGLLLWGLRGEAVFSDTVLAALAWCF